MFDFGWQEFVLIAFVLVLVVGPKELPKILKNFSKFMNQIKSMANEFTTSLENASNDEEIKNVKNLVSDIKNNNLNEISNVIDDNLKNDIKELKSIDTRNSSNKVKINKAKKIKS